MNERNIVIHDGVGRVGTYFIAEAVGIEHKSLIKTINSYKTRFEYFSDLKLLKLKSTGGRAATEYLLDEDQFVFLASLIKNTPTSVDLKHRITKEFKAMRERLKALGEHKRGANYDETRSAGKVVRLETTDEMKAFIVYAKKQGSESADKYYMVITKMLNQLLFISEGSFPNLRNVMSTQQLMTVVSAEQIILRGLKDGMSRKRFYKDIYKDINKRVAQFAELHGQSHVIDQNLLEADLDDI